MRSLIKGRTLCHDLVEITGWIEAKRTRKKKTFNLIAA